MKMAVDLNLYLMAFVTCLISIVTCVVCYGILENQKIKLNKTFALIILFFSTLLMLSNLINDFILKSICIVLIFTVNFKILFKDNLKKTFLL